MKMNTNQVRKKGAIGKETIEQFIEIYQLTKREPIRTRTPINELNEVSNVGDFASVSTVFLFVPGAPDNSMGSDCFAEQRVELLR